MFQPHNMGQRRFGRVNWLGLYTLIRREIMRFMAVWMQTVGGPLVSAGLLLAVFALAIGSRRGDVMGLPFLQFLAPGVIMMTVIQNAFANTSSSMMTAKIQGNIVDTLMPPLSSGEILAGYILGGLARGLIVALTLTVGVSLMYGTLPQHPIWALVFVVLGAAMMGGLGLIAAIVAVKFDQMSAITNFIVTPLSFLSGTFYSIEALPPTLQTLSHFNPIFYLIDGARFGMIGVSDSSPWVGLAVCTFCSASVLFIAWRWLKSGYRLKN